MTSEKIFSIKNPEHLFSGKDYDSVHEEYKKLALQWHPDRNKEKNAEKVFAQIGELYAKAIISIKSGSWKTEGYLELHDKHSGATYQVKYLTKKPFELGEMYIGNTLILFLVNEEYKDLVSNAEWMTRNFKYSSERMEKEVSRYLPKIDRQFVTIDNKFGVMMKKAEDLLLLRDVLNYKAFPEWDRHVAWILSTLHNLSCYFEYAGICHNDISLETYFISPKYHSGALLGGWWYSCRKEDKLSLVPARTYDLIPPDIKRTKISSGRIDLELIRAVGRELLGDETGVHLLHRNAAPSAMVNWLRSTTSRHAVKDYKLWGNILTESFGPKKFVKLDLTADILYPRS